MFEKNLAPLINICPMPLLQPKQGSFLHKTLHCVHCILQARCCALEDLYEP